MNTLPPSEQHILHIALDEKFIDMGLKSFERVYPGKNDLFLSGTFPFKHVKTKPLRTFSTEDIKTSSFIKNVNSYSIVIIHALDANMVRIINATNKDIVFFWIGWGYDFYDLANKNMPDLLLPDTKTLCQKIPVGRTIHDWVKSTLQAFNSRLSKKRAIRKIAFFSPPIPTEYMFVKEQFHGGRAPAYLPWNYGTLEDDLIGPFMNQTCTGFNILIGNSATDTNNHIEAFSMLKRLGISSRKFITPLSYGDMEYADTMIKYGHQILGSSFEPLTDFLPKDDYVKILQSCSFVIMNHVRQQALGNIVIMLYLGAKVFLREENPIYAFLKSSGIILYSIQSLENNPTLLNTSLSPMEKKINLKIISDHWSRSAADLRTLNVINNLIKCSINTRK